MSLGLSNIQPLLYKVDPQQKVNWTATQEKSISRDYPFDLNEETPDQYVARTYLQFLWLPECIMPLKLLVPSISRVNAASSSTSPHPLHGLLEPLLLTPRTAANKYHVELPQILSDGGGAGEIEETMMWFSLNHEKVEDDDWIRSEDANDVDVPWADENWRQKWLERMERREVQIQILLYFLKLSLPVPPPLPITLSPKKRTRRSRREPTVPTRSTEDNLESFMDKLSMWQLTSGLDPSANSFRAQGAPVDERDWMQIFSEDLVEPQFRIQLPEACNLLRTKVFPDSPFSEGSSSRSSLSPRPDGQRNSNDYKKRARSSAVQGAAPHSGRFPPPIPQTTLHKDSLNTSKTVSARSLARSRSRSISVSLAQERESQRAGSVGAGAPKKRVLNREISMSRVFKAKARGEGVVPAKSSDENKTRSSHTTSNQGTYTKGLSTKDQGVTLVAATPTKPKVKSRSRLTTRSQTMVLEEEEDWDLPGSSDVLLLGLGSSSEGFGEPDGRDTDEDEESTLPVTPSKRPPKRAR